MKTLEHTSLTAETAFAETGDRKLAYRMIGNGEPIILCNRFRGTLDTWDPHFLDALAEKYTVITFDYTGIGSSTGSLPTDIIEVAKDVKDLADRLGIERTILLGWSYGGFVTQAATFIYPELVTKTILLGTNPPGKNDIPFEEIFLEKALKPVNDFDDEVILFFEPASEISKAAAALSHERIAERMDVSRIPSAMDVFQRYFAGGDTFRADTMDFRNQLLHTTVPVLVVMGDHDVCFAVENWFPLVRKIKSAQLVVLPQTGHGPQHQYPDMIVGYIDSFVKHFHV